MGPLLAFLLALQQDRIDEALRMGIGHLKAKASTAGDGEEQVLWALVEIGVPAWDPTVAGLLEKLLAAPPGSTRSAALQARILSALDRDRYRDRIGHCAQFLVDNQAADGRWGPGQPVEAPDLHPEPPSVRTPNRSFGPSSEVIIKFQVPRRKKEPVAKTGDPDNSYWALRGLSACRAAGLMAPAETHERALEAWRSGDGDPTRRVTAILAYQSLLNRIDRKDPELLRGMEQVVAQGIPVKAEALLQFKEMMYTLVQDMPGVQEWWPQGAGVLLKDQASDGGWGSIEESCAALQFLHLRRISFNPIDRQYRNGKK